MKLYIIRHGVTEWNAQGRVQGASDIPLAEKGIRLAKLTGEALAEVSFDLCFTSPLCRARQTAEYVLGERKGKIPVIEDKRIQEISFGVLEGRKIRNDAGEITDEDFLTFFNDAKNFKRPKDGENIADIVKRTREFWQEKISDPELKEKTILIASHGCAVRALLQNVYEDTSDFWHGCVPPNCAVNIVEVKDTKAVLAEEDKVFAK